MKALTKLLVFLGILITISWSAGLFAYEQCWTDDFGNTHCNDIEKVTNYDNGNDNYGNGNVYNNMDWGDYEHNHHHHHHHHNDDEVEFYSY